MKRKAINGNINNERTIRCTTLLSLCSINEPFIKLQNKKAKEVLGWEPKFSGKAGFEKGLIQTIEWFSNSHHLDQYKTGMYNV